MARGATARLFVAVDPPPEVCEELAAWARATAAGLGLRAVRSGRRPLRLLAPETLHLTLCFLGSRPVSEIDTIGAALGSAAGQVGELRVGAPLWLPPRRPRALAVEVHDDGGELALLHSEVSAAIVAASDWEPERRRFRAHVTLARLGAGLSWRSREETALPATPQLRFTPTEVVLYRSWLSRGGASYEPLLVSELQPRSG
ncbi:MAG TPA: RNA 2',3'-cyclic phosphodiesterase [Solirubrobacteraceae bacterium]|jgi:2'-5' RNA ligase|nr:RNA 2',3'-cyclic phosphodiesterase [Solirubrobacteraceae bacterium]